MTQDVVATAIALGTAALLVARWWRRRNRGEPACANCESGTKSHQTESPAMPGDTDVKPVAFFGASVRDRQITRSPKPK